MPTLKEIAKSLGLSSEWIKKMGKEGIFDFIKNDPGTPGIPRELTDEEMYTVFRFASYRQAGYPLPKLKEHAVKAKRLKELFLKYKSVKEPINALRRKHPSVDFTIFDLIGTYRYPDQELMNIYPEELIKISKKDCSEINEIIAWFGSEAQEIEDLIKKERKRIKMVSEMLHTAERQLESGQAMFKPTARFFKELEEK